MNINKNIYIVICLATVGLFFLIYLKELGPIPLTDGAIERKNYDFCKAMKEKTINSVFVSYNKDKYGKPAIETSDGKKHTPYGILRHVVKMSKGDSIVKHAGFFDYILYRIKSNDSIVLKAVDGIPCK